MRRLILLLVVAAALIGVVLSGRGPGVAHGVLRQWGCPGNAPAHAPQWGCSFRTLAHQRIDFRTDSGRRVAWTTTDAAGAYDIVLPAGHYRVFAPGIYADFGNGISVYAWRSVRQDICLCFDGNA